MEWGLLGGLGQGLSQAASTVSRGMAEDRATARAKELEEKRAASVERRWQASEARAKRQEQRQMERDKVADERFNTQQQAQAERNKTVDERFERQEKTQAERYKVSDSQFDRQQSRLESQTIERNLSGVMEQANKAVDDIEKRYSKLAVNSMGQPLPQDQLAVLMDEKKKEIKTIRDQYDAIVDNQVKSYGDKLRGTGFAYLLDVPDIEESPGNKPPPPNGQGQTSIDDLFNKAVNGKPTAKPVTGMVKDLETGEMVEAAGTKNTREATFLNSFMDSLGGSYNYESKPIEGDRSPLESAAVISGGLMGFVPGKYLDDIEVLNQEVIQPAYNYLNTKPSQR